MHRTSTVVRARLSSSLLSVTPSWENALKLFQRSLIEAGSTLNIEHSQRLGLLFSKDVGSSDDVEKWASLFNAEDVPTCSLMLKALVHHGNWSTALRLFEWSSDTPAFGQLGEHLAQFLMSEGVYEQSFAVIAQLLQLMESRKNAPNRSENAAASTSFVMNEIRHSPALSAADKDLMQSAMSDLVGLAQNSTYVPKEEETCYCGLGAAVFRAYPKNVHWKEASDILHKLGECTAGRTQIRLAEYEFSKKVYGGSQFEDARACLSSSPIAHESATLQRILLHSLLELGDVDGSLECLERLHQSGAGCVPGHNFGKFCRLFAARHKNGPLEPELERRFVQLVVTNYSIIRHSEARVAIASFFSKRNIDNTFLTALPSTAASAQQALQNAPSQTQLDAVYSATSPLAGSITSLDKTASLLLKEGKWQEALMTLQRLADTPPVNDREQIIRNIVLNNAGDWEKTLLFFS